MVRNPGDWTPTTRITWKNLELWKILPLRMEPSHTEIKRREKLAFSPLLSLLSPVSASHWLNLSGNQLTESLETACRDGSPILTFRGPKESMPASESKQAEAQYKQYLQISKYLFSKSPVLSNQKQGEHEKYFSATPICSSFLSPKH